MTLKGTSSAATLVVKSFSIFILIRFQLPPRIPTATNKLPDSRNFGLLHSGNGGEIHRVQCNLYTVGVLSIFGRFARTSTSADPVKFPKNLGRRYRFLIRDVKFTAVGKLGSFIVYAYSAGKGGCN